MKQILYTHHIWQYQQGWAGQPFRIFKTSQYAFEHQQNHHPPLLRGVNVQATHTNMTSRKTSSSSYSNFFWVAPNKNHPSNKTSKKPCGRRRDQPLYVIWIRLVQMWHQTTNLAKVCSQLHFATYDFPYLRSLMGLMPCMKKDRQTPALNLSFITAMSFKMSTWNLKNIWRSMDLSRPIWWTEDPLLHDHSHSLVVAIMILGSFKKTTLPWELRSRAELVWRG